MFKHLSEFLFGPSVCVTCRRRADESRGCRQALSQRPCKFKRLFDNGIDNITFPTALCLAALGAADLFGAAKAALATQWIPACLLTLVAILFGMAGISDVVSVLKWRRRDLHRLGYWRGTQKASTK